MKRFSLFFLPLILQAATLVPEFVATEEGDNLAGKSRLTGDINSKGEVVLAWLDFRDGGENALLILDDWPQVYLQYLNASGVPEGSNVHLEAGGDFFRSADPPSVVVFNDGLALTATGRINRDNKSHDTALFRLWNPQSGFAGEPLAEYKVGLLAPVMTATDGDSLCVAVRICQDTLEFQLFTRTGELLGQKVFVDSGNVESVIMDSRGNFVVGYFVGNHTLYYRRYDNKGNPLGEKVKVSENGLYLSLAGDPKGTLVASWFEDHVLCRSYSAYDTPLGGTHDLGQGALVDEGRSLGIAQGYGGLYLVVWARGETYYESDILYGQILNAEGVPQGQPIRINVPGVGDVVDVWVGGTGEHYHVAWVEQSKEEYTPSMTIQSRIVGPSGTPASSQHRVCDDEPGGHAEWNEPILAPQGEFFVSWISEDNVWCLRHFSVQGEPSGAVWSSDSVKAAASALGPDGSLYLSYFTEGEDGMYRVWLQRFNNQGVPDGASILVGETTYRCTGTAVAVGSQGDAVVVWEVDIPDGGTCMFGQRISPTGRRLGEAFLIENDYYPRDCLRVFKFEDGDFVVGSNQTNNGGYYCYLYSADGKLEKGPFRTDSVWTNTQQEFTMAGNGKDRFVTVWKESMSRNVCFCVHDRQGEPVCEPYKIPESRVCTVWPTTYYFDVAMAPDGRFVITWEEVDDAGNLNMWGQTFSRDGKPLSAPFQANDPDQWPYSFQFSGWRGVSAQDDRILFTWLENRRHRGWDVMAKVTDWDFPGVEENLPDASPIRLEASINRLSYSVPSEARLSLYSVDGRRILEETIQGSGVFTPASLPQGVYFARVTSVEGSKKAKLVILH